MLFYWEEIVGKKKHFYIYKYEGLWILLWTLWALESKRLIMSLNLLQGWSKFPV